MDTTINYDSLKIEQLNAEEIFSHLVKSETESMQNKSQGAFYHRICFHPHFKKIMDSSLKEVKEDLIIDAFYHCLRNNHIFKFHPKNYPLFLKAFRKLMPDLVANEPYICGFRRYNALLLFDVKEASDVDKLKEDSLEDFLQILAFINKANVYTAYPYVRKKHDHLTPFLENETLMNRIRKGISLYAEFEQGIVINSDFSMVIAASVVLLLKDTKAISKKVLFDWHQQKLSRQLVWVLGSFYKDFQNTVENKSLLKDLYATYAKEWIDEYKYQ